MPRNPWAEGFIEVQNAWAHALGMTPDTPPAKPSGGKSPVSDTPPRKGSEAGETAEDDAQDDMFNDMPV